MAVVADKSNSMTKPNRSESEKLPYLDGGTKAEFVAVLGDNGEDDSIANDTIKKLAGDGHKRVIVAPIGFVCDHVEVLYDLDIEAKA